MPLEPETKSPIEVGVLPGPRNAETVSKHGVGIARLHNSTAAINELPNELFLIILELIHRAKDPDDDPGHRVKSLFGLSAVCHRWRKIMLSTPTFWKTIGFGDKQRIVELSLERSRGALLDVCSSSKQSPSWRDVARVVTPHTSRIARLHLCEWKGRMPPVDPALPLLGLAMPELAILSAVALRIRTDPLSLASFPKLRCLSLHGCGPQWITPGLPNLTSCRLSRLPPKSLPNLVELLRFLQSMPNLQFLMCINAGPKLLAGVRDGTDSSLTALPCLKTFTLRDKHYAPLMPVLKHLGFPSTAKVDVDYKPMDDPEACKVREWRHRIQKAFLSRDPVTEESVAELDQLFLAVECYQGMRRKYLMYSKLLKVLRHVAALPPEKILRNDEFNFTERAATLVKRWEKFIDLTRCDYFTSDCPPLALAIISSSASPHVFSCSLQELLLHLNAFQVHRSPSLVHFRTCQSQIYAWMHI